MLALSTVKTAIAHKSDRSRVRRQNDVSVRALSRCKAIRKVIWRHVCWYEERKKERRIAKKPKIVDLKSLNLSSLGVTELNQLIKPDE